MFDAAIADNIIQRNIHIDGCVRRVLDASVAADIDFTYGDVVVFRVLSSTPGDRVVLRSEVFEKQNTCISAVCLDSQSRDPNEPRLIVHAGDGSSREIKLLDVRVFVENAEVVLKQLDAWSKRSVVARPRLRQIEAPPLPAIEDLFAPVMPAVLGDVSHGIVAVQPQAPVNTNELFPEGMGEVNNFVARLAKEKRFVDRSEIAFVDSGISFDFARRLETAGVIAIREDEFSEHQIALRPEGVHWIPAFGIENPIPACKAYGYGGTPLQRSKLSLLLELYQDGWRPGQPAAVVTNACDKVYRQTLREPLSYYAALVDRKRIFDKGVQQFEHGKTDNYYRCLLRLEPEPLLHMLGNLAGMNDAWFKSQLVNAGADEPEEPVAIEPPEGDPAAFLALQGGAVGLEPPQELALEHTLWSRKLCSMGNDTLVVKIYFDNATGDAGIQRSWLTCVHHAGTGCIRWRNICGTQKQFCAMMYAWHCAALVQPDCATKDGHMNYTPPQNEIDAVEQGIVMVGF